jgi:hypothetical protein
MVVRFGGISDRNADPREILRSSFQKVPWRVDTIVPAGSAEQGKRQSTSFATTRRRATDEFDMWLTHRGC